MKPLPPAYSLTVLAWANVCVHALAVALAGVAMTPGSPLVPLADRLEYLSEAPLGWSVCWVSWMLSCLLLVAFLVEVTRRLGEGGDLARLGLVVAIVGAAFDLFCDTVYIVGFPMIASWQPPPVQLFLTVERLTSIGSLVIANGAYSVAIPLVSMALAGRESPDRATVGLGYAVGAWGLLLAGAGFAGVPWLAPWATVPTIGLFCIWVILVARSFGPRGQER